MKNLLLSLSLIITGPYVQAQPTVTISSGTSWVTGPASFTNFNGLALQPTSAYSLAANTLSRAGTASPAPPMTYVQRVYQSQTAMQPFTGNLIFYYADAELNGLNEDQLALAVYNGATDSWSYFAPSANDPAVNTVTVSGLSNLSIQQVTLVSDAVLPVVFGVIEARITGDTLLVNWQTLKEENVSHFDIEASADGKTFSKIGSTATKAAGGHSDKAISYSVSITLQQLPAITGLLSLALLLVIGFKRKKRWITAIAMPAILLTGTALLHSCKKEKAELPVGKNKIYVRIAQVDTDGKKMYSKIVAARIDQ